MGETLNFGGDISDDQAELFMQPFGEHFLTEIAPVQDIESGPSGRDGNDGGGTGPHFEGYAEYDQAA